MKTKRQNMKNTSSLKELGRKALTVLLTVSMISMNTPFAYALEEGAKAQNASSSSVVDQGTVGMDGAVVAESATAESSSVSNNDTVNSSTDNTPETTVVDTSSNDAASDIEIGLSFDHAYIHYKGQAIASPTSVLMLPAGEDFQFVATADDGCILDEVKATVDGTDTVLEPNASGMYVIAANNIKPGLVVSVRAKNDPFESVSTNVPIDEKRNEKQQFEYEDADVKVVATLTDPSALPANVTFRVTPVTKNTKDAQGRQLYDYDAYMEALNKNAADGKEYTDKNTLIYDVAFLVPKQDADGKAIEGEWTEVQLADGLVKIDMQFKRNQLSKGIDASESANIEINHLPLVDSVRSSVSTTADATNISANDIIVEEPVQQVANVNTEQAEVSLDSLSIITLTAAEQTVVDSGAYPVTVSFVDSNNNPIAPDELGKNMRLWLVLQNNQNQNYIHDVYTQIRLDSVATKTYSVGSYQSEWGQDQGQYAKGDTVKDVFVTTSNDSGASLGSIKQGNGTIYNDGAFVQRYFVSFDVQENVTHVVFRKPDATPHTLTTNVQFVNDDKETLMDALDPQLTKDIYAVAKLTTKESGDKGQAIGYAIKKLSKSDLNSNRQGMVAFTEFQLCDASGNPTEGTINYNTVDFNADVSLYTKENGEVTSLNDAMNNADRSVGGYDVISNDEETNEQGNTTTTIKLRKQFTKKLHYTVELKDGINLQGANCYLLVKLTHRTGGDSYYLQKLSFNGGVANVGPITNWKDSSGNNKNETFTGNEQGRDSYIVISNNGSLSMGDAVNGNNCTKLDGSNLYANSVSISHGEVQSQTDEATRTKTYDQTITISNYLSPVADIDFEDFLGNAKYFGIVANRWNKDGADSETNFAVKIMHDRGGQTGNLGGDKINYENGEEARQPIFIGAIDLSNGGTGVKIKSDAVDLYIPSDISNLVTHEKGSGAITVHPTPKAEIDAYVDSMIEGIRATSEELVNLNSYNADKVSYGNGNLTLDFKAYPGGTYCVSLDDPAVLNAFKQTGGVTIKKNPNQFIVLNSKTTGSISIDKFRIENGDYSADSDSINCGGSENASLAGSSVLFNLPYATSVELNRTVGVFYAPNAKVNMPATSGGWIVCNEIRTGDEWHSIWHKFNHNYGKTSATITANKLLNNAAPGNKHFKFQISEGNTVIQTVRNDDQGKVKFVLTFAEAGTHTYTVTEVNEGADGIVYDTHSFPVTVTVVEDSATHTLKATVTYGVGANRTFMNTKTDQKTGDLKVSKTVESNVADDSNIDFNFTVTLGNTGINGTYGGMTFTNGVATFTLKNGGEKVATGLPLGTTYTVVEEANDDFTTTKEGDTGAISATPSQASFVNARTEVQTGDLEVSKKVVSDAAADADQEFAFTVTLSDKTISGTYGGMTFANGVATLSLKGGQKATATGLPTGVTYTVTEAASDGFATGKTGDAGAISTTKSVASFTNTRKTGDLEVSKKVISDAAADADQEFAFTVTLSDATINGVYGGMTFANGVATLSLKGGQKATATGLPTGVTYTVTEAANDDFATGKAGDAGTISTTKSVASFTNTRKTGDLEVTKSVPNEDEQSRGAKFAFTVTLSDKTINGAYGGMTFANGVATFELESGGKKSATGLPTGITYTVEEAQSSGYVTTTNGSESGAIVEGTTTAAFVNTRVEKGDLVVSKTVESALEADHTKEFAFTVTLGNKSINGTYGDMTFKNGVATFKLKDTESKRATDLPNGTTYTVSEAEDGDFTSAKTGESGTVTDRGTATASFTNTRKTGEIELSKTVVSDAAADADRIFTFTVQLNPALSGSFGSGDNITTFNNEGKATVSLRGGESKTISGLPVGIGYTVTEAKAEGFELTEKTGDKGTISTSKAEAKFTNTREKGELELSKKLVSDVAADANQEFTFTVTLTGLTNDAKNGTYSDVTFNNGVATVTLKGGESKTIGGLPCGISYAIAETQNNDFVAVGTGITSGITTTKSQASFTNTRKTGDLEVSKKLVSDAAADKDQKFTFTVELSDKTIGGSEGKTFGDMTFKNGVATFELQGGQKATATGLPVGVTYMVNEQGNGDFQTESTGNEGAIVDVQTGRAAFTNTRKTGDLEVSKTVVSDTAADKDQKFTFTVELSDKSITKTFGDMTFKNGVATFELQGGQKATATGLPVGVTYTVNETGNGDFQTESTGNEGAIVDGQTGRASFTNTRKTGSLEVSKKVVSDAAADADQEFTFTVSLTDATINKTYSGVLFTDGVATVTLKGGETKLIEGLPTGVTYTVTEATNEAFSTEKTGDSGAITANKAKASFTNTRKTGDLKLSKVLVSDAAADADQAFTFTITLGDTTISKTYSGVEFVNGVANVTLKGGESKTIEGLPVGVTYAITEAGVEGFQNTGKTGEAGTISTEPSEATFTNERDKGGLIVKKTVVSDAAADKDQEFEFTVTLSDTGINGDYGQMAFANGVATFKLKGGETKSATDLPTGVSYTVNETGNGNFDTQSTGNTGKIAEGSAQEAAFVNTRKTGSLELGKEIVSRFTTNADQEFVFTITLGDDSINKTYSGVEFASGVATVTLKGGESKTVEGLPTGVAYTVTEADAAGFQLSGKTGDSGTISTAKSEAKFTNTHKTGDLTVRKSVVSDAAADADVEFSFTVTLSDTSIHGLIGDMLFTDGVAHFKLKNGASKTAYKLPVGITYTVTEEQAEGFELTGKTGDEGAISTSPAVVEFTNTRKTGDLKLSKQIVSNRTADKDQEFTFTVTLSDTTINKAYSGVQFVNGVATVTLKGGESKTVEGLPTGVSYTVTEADAAGFQLSGKTGDSGTISTAKSEAKFTNTRETGDLEVSKTLFSDAAADKDQEFEFTVTLSDKGISGTYGDMEFAGGVATVELKGGETKAATGLPTDVNYTVSERAVDGFQLSGKTGETGTISTSKSTASFTNTRKTGDLEVSKTVVSDAAADKDQEFEFTVTLSETTITKRFGDMDFHDGVATFKLKGGQTASASGLPTGIGYTVVETTNGDFNTVAQGQNGIISSTKSVATFTNTRKTGSLELSKTLVSDAAADAEQEFTFTVTLDDASINKAYSGVQFVNGVATVTLKGGESKLIEGLPTGVGYAVTETAYESFDTQKSGENGTISSTKSEAKFTNTRKTGSLKLSKELVSDVAADAGQEFTFTVTLAGLSAEAANKTYSDVQFVGGVATVILKGGESKTIEGLPVGITYTITEADVEGFQNTGKTGDSGTISQSLSEAKFTNSKDKGGLVISKTLVSDAAADANQEFTFHVTLSDTSINKTYSDVQFAEGKATVTLKGGESKAIEGLPIGVSYTVTEDDAEGFVVQGKTGDTGTIAKDVAGRAEFTNARQTGNLTLSKELVSQAAADADQVFAFKVTLTGLTEGAANKTYGDVPFTKGVATVTLKGGQSKTIEGLPTGVTYKVTEDTIAGFEQTGKTGDEGTVSTTSATASFQNTRDKGDLTVSKAVVSDAAADKSQEFDFTVTLNDAGINGTYGDMTFTNGVAAFKLKDAESKTARQLPVGVTYTVVEASNGDFTTTRSAGDGAIAKQGSAITFTNTRTTGELEVSKSVKSSTASDKNKEFLFTVDLHDETINKTYGDMRFEKGVARIAVKDGETKKATGIPTGLNYTVVEDVDSAYTTTKTGQAGTISTTKSEAKFVNTKDEGGLIVAKSVTSPSANDHEKLFGFTVKLDDESVNGTYGDMTFTNGIATFDLKDGDTKQASGLAKGIAYTVTEATDNDFVTEYTNKTGTIPDKFTRMVEVVNTRKTGGFDVSKAVVSDAAADANQVFTFDVVLSDSTISGTYGDLTFNTGTATVTLKGGDVARAEGLPTGITYTVTETSNAAFNTNAQTQTGNVAEDATSASFTNTRKTGDLEVSKTVVSDAAADADQQFEFTVTLTGLAANKVNGTYGNMKFANGVAKVSLKGGQKAQATGLPTGISYTVEETANNDFNTTPTSRAYAGTISEQKSVAAFTNTRKTGDLEVSKVVVSNAAADKNQAFAFTVTLSDNTIEGTYGQMTFKGGVARVDLKGGQKATAAGLPTGITYAVTEAANADFVTTSNNAEGSITTTKAEATFTNTRKQGGLMVHKTVVSDAAADKDQSFDITVTLSDKSINGTYGDMTFENGVAKTTIAGGQNKLATGLPTGITYTVEETANDDFTTTYAGETGRIVEANEPALATITNTRKTADLTVSKSVVSSRAADADQTFEFTVTLSDNTIAGTYGNMTFDQGVSTVSLKGGQSATAKGLPTGVTYEVTEASQKGFTNTKAEGATGTISQNGATASFENTRETGELTVSKAVESAVPALDDSQEFTFTVKLEGAALNGKYGDMSFTNGVATVVLKGGQSATAKNLPTDVDYTVTEAKESSAGFEVQKTGDAGVISTQGATAAFTNKRLVGSLKIQKNVQVDNAATSTNVADGTYTFTVTGPGAYKDGVDKAIAITNGASNTVTLENLFVGTYNVAEKTDGLPSNMRLLSQNPQTVTVEANNTATVPTAEFVNNLRSTKAHASVTKMFSNWDGIKWEEDGVKGFAFKLVPVDGAPMPANTLVPNEETKVATSEEPVEFSDITYTREGTYRYKLSEVVPAGADQNGVYKGVTYDTTEHDVVVTVRADQSGNLHASVAYDDAKSDLTITNTYAATGQAEIKGAKELSGRKFKEGDVWTFTIASNDEQAPMPEQRQITVDASKNATIDFGVISGFDFEDVGKTYSYTITEEGNVDNVVNDAAKTVTVTVADNGDGTLAVTPSTSENPLVFTNKAQIKADLVAKKGIDGRSWKTNENGEMAEEYTFQLYDADEWSAEKRTQSGMADTATTRGVEHNARFGTLTFTTDDLTDSQTGERYFTYAVQEVIPEDAVPTQVKDKDGNMETVYLKNGIQYNEYRYDVQYRLFTNNDGELQVETTYSRGDEKLDGLNILNTYHLDEVPITIKAQKELSGRAITDDDVFQFALYYVNNGKVVEEPEQIKTAVREADGQYRATFDPKVFSSEVTENYIIREVVPQGASQNAEGVWVKDGISYDTADHKVKIVTTDEQKNGKLTARAYYDDSEVAYGEQNNTTLPTFKNTYFGAEANISFNKEYIGQNLAEGAFTFTMAATDESFKDREGAPIVYNKAFVDDGQALKATLSNGAFRENTAKVDVPTITYHQPGTYYYRIIENARDDMSYDAAQINVTVTVDNNARATVRYAVVADGQTTEVPAGQNATLYNNGMVSMAFRANALRANAEATSFTNFEPAVRKVLKNGVLRNGEFSFSLYAGNEATGQPLDTASNDVNGMVSFNDIQYGPADIGKTYTYTIVENGDNVPNTIKYDKSTIRLSVVVSVKDGAIVAEPTYTKFDVDGKAITENPDTFINEYDSIVIRTIKRSREEPHDPLPGAHYGLWMVNPNGEDVYMGLGRNQLEQEGSKLESNDQGELYYDFPMVEGVAYYFLEEFPPPAGHLVDPYPTDYFTLVHDKETDQFRIVYETDPLFAQKCPDVQLRE